MIEPAVNRLELLEQEAKLTEKIAKLREKVGEKAGRVSRNLGNAIGGTAGASAAGYGQIASLQAQIAQDQALLAEAESRLTNPQLNFAMNEDIDNMAANMQVADPAVHQQALKDIQEINDRIRAGGAQLQAAMTQVAATITSAFAQSFSELGPEGEILAPVIESFSILLSTLSTLQSTLADSGMDMEAFTKLLDLFDGTGNFMDKLEELGTGLAATFAGMSAAVGAFAALEMAESKQRVRRIDQQIEQEKRRDGKSKESVNRINQLEA